MAPPRSNDLEVERGDVLLSLDLALGGRRARPRRGRPARPIRPRPPRPDPQPSLIDPATGAGTAAALARDLGSPRVRRRHTGRPTLARVFVDGPARDLAATDGVLRTLVEVAPFVLGGADRVYRTGPGELSILLAGEEDPRSLADRLAGRAAAAMRLRGVAPPRLRVSLDDPVRAAALTG